MTHPANQPPARRPNTATARPSRRGWLWLAGGGLALTGAAGVWWATRPPDRAGVGGDFTYEVVNRYPHDPEAFTQGLIYHDGFFYEGTGQYGRSTLRKVEPETGRVLRSVDLPPGVFGEGITLWGDAIVMLTWQERVAFIYDLETFELRREVRYPPEVREGWGLTHDGASLLLTEGSANLHFLDPETLAVRHTRTVTEGMLPADRLNELEYIDGVVYANVWGEEYVLRIDPDSGDVLGRLDLAGLRPEEVRGERDAVLNGIAHDAAGNRLFVTGKHWPTLFEIRPVPRA